MQKPLKQKKCRNCGNHFVPNRPLETWCSFDCGVAIAQSKLAKKKAQESTRKRVEHREAKERLKTRKDWMREAQVAFNSFIRARDKDLPCISSGIGNTHYVSGVPKQTSWDAGHYRSVGSCPELRFCELNVHKQSVHDNQHLHGNLIEFRKGLIERIGLEKVEWLEGHHPAKHYSVEELKTIKQTYKAKLAALKHSIVD